MQLDGASVVVTGGSSGLGLATAQQLIEAGARVASRTSPNLAKLRPPCSARTRCT